MAGFALSIYLCVLGGLLLHLYSETEHLHSTATPSCCQVGDTSARNLHYHELSEECSLTQHTLPPTELCRWLLIDSPKPILLAVAYFACDDSPKTCNLYTPPLRGPPLFAI